MDIGQIFQAVLALIFVIGLLFITLWLIKFCQQKGLTGCLGQKPQKKNRLKIIERHRLDAKNTLLLVKCDSQEFLLVLGNTNMLLKSFSAKVADHD